MEKIDDNDDYMDMLGTLFICEDYITKTFRFHDRVLPLLCSNMATVSHATTIQLIIFNNFPIDRS
jgi:hypothetical protein